MANANGYVLTPAMFRRFVRFGHLQKPFELSLMPGIMDAVEYEVIDFCRQSSAFDDEEEE